MTQGSPTAHERWVWQLEQLTKDRVGEYVTIEILDPAHGDGQAAERLPFAYAAYDPRDDVVVIAVGGNTPTYPVVLRHMIWHPTEVAVDADIGALKVVEKEGTTTITSFHRPPGQA
jgi:Family of unknown function (DUF5335)